MFIQNEVVPNHKINYASLIRAVIITGQVAFNCSSSMHSTMFQNAWRNMLEFRHHICWTKENPGQRFHIIYVSHASEFRRKFLHELHEAFLTYITKKKIKQPVTPSGADDYQW